MISDIRARLETKQFVPFSIQMNGGRTIQVPHLGHIGVFTYSVAVEDDQGTVRVLPARDISAVTIPKEGDK
jgi:hypothetical protein